MAKRKEQTAEAVGTADTAAERTAQKEQGDTRIADLGTVVQGGRRGEPVVTEYPNGITRTDY